MLGTIFGTIFTIIGIIALIILIYVAVFVVGIGLFVRRIRKTTEDVVEKKETARKIIKDVKSRTVPKDTA